MTITQLRAILKDLGLGARKINASRYGVTANGETLFSLDISRIRDEAHATMRIQQELDYAKEKRASSR